MLVHWLMVVTIGLLMAGAPAGAAGFSIRPADRAEWVYAPGERIVLIVKGSVNELEVSDVWDRVVWRGKGAGTFEVPLTGQGFFRIRSAGRDQGSLAVILRPATVSSEENKFGVNFHLTRVPLGEAGREIALAKRLGIGWGRGMLPDWEDMPPPGTDGYAGSFRRFDDLLARVEKSGLRPLGGIYYFPRWASGNSESWDYLVWSRTMPDKVGPIEQFGEAWARRCRTFVTHWEIGNEVDAELFWKGRVRSFSAGDDAGIIRDYVDFLRAAGAGFRRGHPEAQVVFAGLTSVEGGTYRPFLRSAMAAGADRAFDVMNVHYATAMTDVRTVLQMFGRESVPVWVTEIGGHSDRTPAGERRQIVDDITQAVIQLATGAGRVFKYDLRDDGENGKNREDNFGLVYRDFCPKPSYAAQATMIRMLAGTKPVQELNIVKRTDRGWLRGFWFAGKDGEPIHVIWLNGAEAGRVDLRTPEAQVRVVDIMGNERTVASADGCVRFSVDTLPFFLIGRIVDEKGRPEFPGPKLRSEAVLAEDRRPGGVGVTRGAGDWQSVHHLEVKVSALPGLDPEEYRTVWVEGMIGLSKVSGRGVALTCSFYEAKGERISWTETPFRSGTRKAATWQTNEAEVPPGAVRIRADLYVSPGTTGEVKWGPVRIGGRIYRKGRVR